VANDVEVEQIVHDEEGGGEEGALASYVQVGREGGREGG